MLSAVIFEHAITQDYRIKRVKVLGMVGAKVQVLLTMGKRRVVQVVFFCFLIVDVKFTNCNSSNMLSILHFQIGNCNCFWKYYTGLSNQKSGGFGNGWGKSSSFVDDGKKAGSSSLVSCFCFF